MSDEQPLQTVAPEVLEGAMVEKALAEDPTGTAGDKAAAFFQRSAHDLEMLLEDMSHRALKRMIMNVATYPFLDRDYSVKKNSTEAKASYRFNEMVWQKTIMQLEFEQQKALKAIEEGKEKETHTLQKGEESGTKET